MSKINTLKRTLKIINKLPTQIINKDGNIIFGESYINGCLHYAITSHNKNTVKKSIINKLKNSKQSNCNITKLNKLLDDSMWSLINEDKLNDILTKLENNKNTKLVYLNVNLYPYLYYNSLGHSGCK